jgi:hypothetical protein
MSGRSSSWTASASSLGADMCALHARARPRGGARFRLGWRQPIKGTFALSESELRFGPLATTMMAGPDPAMQRERAFLDALARVTSYELDGRLLTLLSGDEAVARLSC